MKAPKANESKEAIALRRAACEFAEGTKLPVLDDEDTAGQKRNIALLKAACAYARVTNCSECGGTGDGVGNFPCGVCGGSGLSSSADPRTP